MQTNRIDLDKPKQNKIKSDCNKTKFNLKPLKDKKRFELKEAFRRDETTYIPASDSGIASARGGRLPGQEIQSPH